MPAPSDRRLLSLIFATTMTSLMGNALLAPVIPDILDHFGRPDGDSGYLIAATSLPGVFIAPIIGVLADRLGRRKVLVPCLAIFGLAGLAAAIAPTFILLLLARFFMGWGAAGLVNLAVVLIGDRFEGERRTHWIGINAGMLTVALAVFPLFGGFLAELGGWRLALAPYGLGLIGAVWAWHVLDNVRPENPRSFGDQLGGAGEVLRRPSILANLMAAVLMFAIIFGVFLAALPTHLENEFGLSSGWRGLVIGLPAVSSSLSAFNLGRIRQRFSTKQVLFTGSSMWVVAFLTMGLSVSLAVLLIGAFIYGFGEGAMIPSMQNSALDEAPTEHRAVVLASWTASARLGQTVGPLGAGLVISAAGTDWALLTGVVGAALLLALFATTSTPRFASRTA